MELMRQKQRFEPLNDHVVLPKDRKEEIRQRLHAEIDRIVAGGTGENLGKDVGENVGKGVGEDVGRDIGKHTGKDAFKDIGKDGRPQVWGRWGGKAGSSLAAVAAVVACIAVGIGLTGHSGPMSGLVHGPGMGQGSASSASSDSSAASAASAASSSAEQFSAQSSGTTNGSSAANGPQQSIASPKTLDAGSPVALYGTYGWVLRGTTLLHSQDAGASWQRVNIPFHNAPYTESLTAVNGLVAFWAVGQIGSTSGTITVYRTQDGGKTWQSTNIQENLPGSTAGQVPKRLVFATPKDGFMLTDIPLIGMGGTMPGGIYRTGNGGETWTRLSPTGFARGLVPFPWLSFQSSRVGWTEAAEQIGADVGVTNGRYTLFRTVDGGQTWNAVQVGSTSADGNGSNGKVDFGAPVWSSSGGYMTCVSLDAKGQRQLTLYRSTRSGGTWTPIWTFSAGNASGPTLAAFGSTVWVGWNGTLWMSSDAGQTWQPSSQKFGRVTELDLGDPNEGYVVSIPTNGDSSNFTVYGTKDGGVTWNTVPVN